MDRWRWYMWTKKATDTCEFALREALSLGQNYVNTEHILLALVRRDDTVRRLIAQVANIDSTEVEPLVRAAVVRFLANLARPADSRDFIRKYGVTPEEMAEQLRRFQ